MRFRRLDRFKTGGAADDTIVSIPLPKTPEGRVYRYSPSENAHPRHFVLGNRTFELSGDGSTTARMSHPPGTPGTVCPYSGTKTDDGDFNHPDDIAAAVATVEHALKADVQEHFHQMFSDLGRRSSSKGFLTVKTGPRPTPAPAPRFVRQDLLRELICDDCGRDYGVFAISLFCPDCGSPNIHIHFAREVALVREQVQIADNLTGAQTELAYRLLGNAHEDVLTAFEATLKTVYLYKATAGEGDPAPIKAVGNAFQNIERTRERFAEFDYDPFARLEEHALAALTLNIQKRHIIGHNLGVADAAFAQHAADARLGETVPLVGEDIIQFAEIGHQVVNELDTWLANGNPPRSEATMTRPIRPPAMRKELTIGELSPLAIKLGLWMATGSRRGLNELIEEKQLVGAFPDVGLDELGLAVAELKKDDYINTRGFIGARIPLITLTNSLYLTFDPHALGSDINRDIAAILDIIMANADQVDAASIHEKAGWPLRRFNPPFAYIVAHLDERRVYHGSDNYAAGGFLMMDEDKIDLRRLAKRLNQPR